VEAAAIEGAAQCMAKAYDRVRVVLAGLVLSLSESGIETDVMTSLGAPIVDGMIRSINSSGGKHYNRQPLRGA
jgi:hypothetical protein